MMDSFFPTLIEAMSVGSMYAVIALGVALIVGVARIMNFAHGDLIMIAGYAVAVTAAVSWQLAIFLAIALTVLVAIVMEFGVFRWARGADLTTLLIIAFALSQFIQSLMTMIVGGTPFSTSFGIEWADQIEVFGLFIPKLTLITLGVAGTLLILFAVLLMKTRFGLQLRAASEDFVMARMIGINANRVISGAFALSGLAAGAGGVLLIAKTGLVTPIFGVQPVLIAFVAIIIGGLGSLIGAAVGGITLGFIFTFLQTYLPPSLSSYRESLVYLLVIGILLFRPQGFFKGTQVGERI